MTPTYWITLGSGQSCTVLRPQCLGPLACFPKRGLSSQSILDHSPHAVSLVSPPSQASPNCRLQLPAPVPGPFVFQTLQGWLIFRESKLKKPYLWLKYIQSSCSLHLKGTSRVHRAFAPASCMPNLLEGRQCQVGIGN